MNEKSGFRRGAIRMEYVIVAVLVVAAVIVALLFFGRSVANSVGVAGQATTGNRSKACEMQSAQENRSEQATAERACKSFSDSRDAAETSVRAAEVDIPLPDDDRGRERNDVK